MPRRWSCSPACSRSTSPRPQALDGEMAARIRQPPRAARRRLAHGRGAAATCRRPWPSSRAPDRAVLVDCLTLWLTNLMLARRDPVAGGRAPARGAGGAAGAGGAGLERGRPGRRAAGRAEPRLRRPCRPAAPAARRRGRLGPAHGRRACRSTSRRRRLTRRHAPPEHAGRSAGGDVEAAVDLGQTPGEIVFLSAADSELACLAARPGAAGRRRARACGSPTCCSSRHPLSVDLYVERVVAPRPAGRGPPARRPRLLALRARAGGGRLPRARHRARLPARRRPRRPRARRALDPAAGGARPPVALPGHGGIDNAEQALRYAASLLGRDAAWRRAAAPAARRALPSRPPAPMPGRPTGRGRCWCSTAPWSRAATWRRSTRCCERSTAAGLAAAGLYVTSLKDAEARRAGRGGDRRAAPGGDPQRHRVRRRRVDGAGDDPLAAADAPVLQVVLAGSAEAGLARRHARPGAARPRHARGAARARRPDRRLRGVVQGARASATRAPRPPSPATGRCPTASRIVGRARRRLGAPARARPAAERRVAHRARQLPDRATAGSPTASGSTRRRAASRCCSALRGAGYGVERDPGRRRRAGRARSPPARPTSWPAARGARSRVALPLADYRELFAGLPAEVRARAVDGALGAARGRPAPRRRRASRCSVLPLGQRRRRPAAGARLPHRPGGDLPRARTSPRRTATSPSISGCATSSARTPIVHLGKHGNLEWLPGKATALSADCLPEAVLGPLPHLYPFIVNDPGEGTQAKRRAGGRDRRPPDPAADPGRELGRARRAGGPGRRVSRGGEPRPAPPASICARAILDAQPGAWASPATSASSRDVPPDEHLARARQPSVRAEGAADPRRAARLRPRARRASSSPTCWWPWLRLPRGRGEGGDASLLRALAADLGLGWDPLGADAGRPLARARGRRAAGAGAGPWRTAGRHGRAAGAAGPAAGRRRARGRARLDGDRAPCCGWLERRPAPGRGRLRRGASWRACCAGLDGRRVAPGPSGAPTRGRPEVLPTGRNFYSVDCRAVPTPAAWQLGWRSAELVVEQHLQTPRHLPAPGGALGLGHRQHAHRRRRHRPGAGAAGLPPGLGRATAGGSPASRCCRSRVLGRPRVDVTLRVSGFFRDAFPAQIELLDDAVPRGGRASTSRESDEPAGRGRARGARPAGGRGRAAPTAARRRATSAHLRQQARRLRRRPAGADRRARLARRGRPRRAPGSPGAATPTAAASTAATRRPTSWRSASAGVELVLHNQDNREHDLLDSDDYYQFEGGLAATVRHLSGRQPEIYHNDHSRPEHPARAHAEGGDRPGRARPRRQPEMARAA